MITARANQQVYRWIAAGIQTILNQLFLNIRRRDFSVLHRYSNFLYRTNHFILTTIVCCYIELDACIVLVDAAPEAAKVVYESGIPIYMAGLDVTEKALVFPEDFERIRAVGNKVAEVVADWLEFFYGFHRKLGYPGAPVHDAVAVAALIKPEIMTFKDLYVQVETAGDYCKGTTVGDWYGVTGKAPNASCILDIDRQGFVDLLVEAVKTYA